MHGFLSASEATTASLFETSTNADGDAPVVMATVMSLDDDVGVGSFTDDTDQYENSDLGNWTIFSFSKIILL